MNPLIKIFVKLKSSYVIFESQKGMKFPQENVVLQNIANSHAPHVSNSPGPRSTHSAGPTAAYTYCIHE